MSYEHMTQQEIGKAIEDPTIWPDGMPLAELTGKVVAPGVTVAQYIIDRAGGKNRFGNPRYVVLDLDEKGTRFFRLPSESRDLRKRARDLENEVANLREQAGEIERNYMDEIKKGVRFPDLSEAPTIRTERSIC